MAYTYHDFESDIYTEAERLSRLKLHIGEVQLQMGPDVAADGKSRSIGGLVEYLRMLREKLTELEQGPSQQTAGGVSRLRLLGKRF